MAKDPAFLWYWGDWSGGTVTFSRAMKGAYMDLLNAQWNSGSLSLDEIKTVLGADFGQMWPTLQKKFEKDDRGLYCNPRMEQEREKRKRFTESRRINAQAKHMLMHMENENRNKNKDKNENEKYAFLDDFKFSDAFSEYLEMRKKIKKPATERAKTLVLKELHKHDLKTAIAMLEQSILNSWQGIFPVKEHETPKKIRGIGDLEETARKIREELKA